MIRRIIERAWLIRRRAKREGTPAGRATRVIDMAAGPPPPPAQDRGLDLLQAEQAGLADAPLYDQYSFTARNTPLYLRASRAMIRARIAQSRREQNDDHAVANEFIADAQARKVLAAGQAADARRRHASADETAAYHRRVLRGEEPAEIVWRAPERLNEARRATTAWALGVPLIGLLVEVPWSYYALQVLGESPLATAAMAVVFGWAGVLLAHLAGVLVRRARTDGWNSGIAAVAGAMCLVAIAVFLADIRFAFLAAPIITGPGTKLQSGLHQFHLIAAVVFIGWLAVNIGLWTAVAILAYLHHNPHVTAHQRAQAELAATSAEVIETTTATEAAEHELANALARAGNCGSNWDAHRAELATFADRLDATYLRALATSVGDPEFTTALEHSTTRTATGHHERSEDEATGAQTAPSPNGHHDGPVDPTQFEHRATEGGA